MAGSPRIFWQPRPLWKRAWLWAGVALAVLLLGNSGARRLASRYLELRRLRHEQARLKIEEARLQKEIEGAQRAGPAFERSARLSLGYLKPGEVEYRFPPPKKRGKD